MTREHRYNYVNFFLPMDAVAMLNDFEALREEMFGLYGRGQFRDALDLLDREGFPFVGHKESTLLYWWRVCLNAVIDNHETAIDLLREAVDKGYWYSEQSLRQDTDLESLQGNPDFEEQVERAEALRQHATQTSEPHRVTVAPLMGAPQPYPLAMVLHAQDDYPEWHMRHWRGLTQSDWLLAGLQSTMVGSNAAKFVWADDRRALVEIKSHYKSLSQSFAVDPNRVILGGMSRGARAAAWAAMDGDWLNVRGLLAVAPGFPTDLAPWEARIAAAGAGDLRVFVVSGADDTAFLPRTTDFLKHLEAAGVTVEHRVIAGVGHQYPPNFDVLLKDALAFFHL